MPNDNFNLQEFNRTLVDVRKAYRLLFDYQARVRDLVSYIRDIYDLQYLAGLSKYSGKPKEGADSLRHWAWDWLSMYYYEFHFQEKVIDNKTSRFSIFHLADSGFYDTKFKEEKNIDKLNLSEFTDVQSSRTRLIFVAANNWEVKDFKINTGDWQNKYLLCSEPYGVEKKDNRVFIFKHYELSEFKDEETALKTLRDFKEFAGIHGIPFEIKESILL